MRKDNLISFLQDFLSSNYIKFNNYFSLFCGTAMFLIKAYIFGVSLKSKIRCWGSIFIMRAPKSKIILGNNVHFVSSSKRCVATSLYAAVQLRTLSETSKIIIEDNVYLSGTSITARSKTVHIGEGTIIAPNVVIVDSDFHGLWPPDNRVINPTAAEKDEDVVIGKNVWIGIQSILLKGVSVGDNSVIAAGSIVTTDIPANVLAGGVPARIIRRLP